ncbi:MAG: hypothetical protein ACREI3_05970 [Nitrospirales bacterium]
MVAVLFSGIWTGQEPDAARLPDELGVVSPEEYPVYDRVVIDKFLTSYTELVVIERVTAIRLGPGWPPLSVAFMQEGGFFGGRLPPALITDFVLHNRQPALLQPAFDFGVRVQFVRDGVPEEPNVSLAPIPARLVQAPPVIGILRFSRVGFSPREDQALVYIEVNRRNGTGAGFLIWLDRTGREWTAMDTEVLWTARPDRR